MNTALADAKAALNRALGRRDLAYRERNEAIARGLLTSGYWEERLQATREEIERCEEALRQARSASR